MRISDFELDLIIAGLRKAAFATEKDIAAAPSTLSRENLKHFAEQCGLLSNRFERERPSNPSLIRAKSN